MRVCNKKLFWVRIMMYRKEQVLKMSDLVRKEIRGIFRTKNPTKDERREKELDHNSTASFVYVRSDVMSKIIKNCRGEKKRQKNKRFQV